MGLATPRHPSLAAGRIKDVVLEGRWGTLGKTVTGSVTPVSTADRAIIEGNRVVDTYRTIVV